MKSTCQFSSWNPSPAIICVSCDCNFVLLTAVHIYFSKWSWHVAGTLIAIWVMKIETEWPALTHSISIRGVLELLNITVSDSHSIGELCAHSGASYIHFWIESNPYTRCLFTVFTHGISYMHACLPIHTHCMYKS